MCLSSGPIFEDTRQQAGRHRLKNEWWAAHGVEVVRRKLDAGDYGREGSNVLVDTKQGVQELAGNVGREHARFVRELDRARVAGCRLYILVEERPEYADRSRLATWRSSVCLRCRRCDPLASKCRARRFKPLNGPQLAKIVARLEERHGCRFMFCDRRDTARIVCELLGVRYER